MENECTIQLYAASRWHDVANTALLGPAQLGWRTPTYTGYDAEWALEHAGARDAWALGSRFPVSLAPQKFNHWPVFLIDMLPQGYGRGELLRQLKLPETLESAGDWPLLLAGAGNPIGHLRIKEAAQWLQDRSGPVRGFTDTVVAERSEDFMHYLSLHGLFVAGSSGVQGEWPKLLMTRAKDGLLYLDHTLPDSEGVEHFIVKFGRGANEQLATILRQEAPYMTIAAHLGVRVHAPLTLRERALFIPRFDRARVDGQLVRLGQESLAALTGRAGFGVVPSHDEACVKLAEVCSDPQAEILEYLRRDIANIAFGNTDNHARNTAIQRDFDGRIRLTPVFDFAPMYLHPDGLARRIRWEDKENVTQDWNAVLGWVAETCELKRGKLVAGLQAMVNPLLDVAENGKAFGLEPAVHQYLEPGIRAQARALEALH
ncbi:type II toxin-antitoxin system HipA family toxin [Sulfuriferula plumbiphila]|nr:HipA domain-containing protein [Sulfuriferula plumbiphila]